MEKMTTIELRVLGALIEKQISTPDYYPLTMNALVNACNQKSNRDPVTQYDEMTVELGLDALRKRGYARKIFDEGGRTPKYAHNFTSTLKLSRAEVAILTELMLRGPQTLGELKGRCTRLFQFEGITQVEETLNGLMQRDEPLAIKLPRATGAKESRYAHLLGDEPPAMPDTQAEEPEDEAIGISNRDRIDRLEQEIVAIRREMTELRQRLTDLANTPKL